MTAHLVSGAAGLDLGSATMMTRNVLAAAATAVAWSDRNRPGRPGASTYALAGMPEGQTQLAQMVSIIDAIRTNAYAVPQSLREFVA